ncbi:MAG: ADOP family duplicated permease [Vicinamibacterales bacterium]
MPDWKSLVSRRLRQFSPDEDPDVDIVEELTAHLQDRYEDYRSAGLDEDEAVEATLSELSDSDRVDPVRRRRRETTRRAPVPDVPPGRSRVSDFWRDVQYGARLLLRHPGFTATVVVTLAFGIAANTTAFTVINSLLLHPLPVENASQLVNVSTRETADPANANAQLPLSHPNLADFRARNDVFSNLAGYSGPFSITLTGGPLPERMFAELVTANYFETLGVKPRIGRFFLPEEDRAPGAHPVLVLGYAPWQRRFGARPDITGHTIEINGQAFTVIGIAPEGFKGLDPVFGPDVWIPSMMTEQVVPAQKRNWLRDRAAAGFSAIGRLRPGRTLAQAESNLATIAGQLAREYPSVNRGRGVSVLPLSRATLMGVSPQLAVLGSVALMAVPGLVLLIACSNVANLLLARATARRHEIGVRLALGAGQSRVVRQLLTESALLGLISGVVGLGAALGGSQLLSSLRPAEFAQNLVDISVDLNVVLFGMLLAAMTTVVFGAAPALDASRSNLVAALNSESRTAGQQKRSVRMRHALLVGQVALSLMALITAGLFLRSVQRAYGVDPGFERHHLAVVLLNPGQAGYNQARAEQLYRTVRDRIAAIPGVTSVSWASNMPLFTGPSRKLSIDGRSDAAESTGALTVVTTVDLDYFTTAGIAITRGRDFAEVDREGNLPVAIINETLARQYWLGGDPIGQRVSFVGDTVTRQIVGVAETVNYDEIGEPSQPCVYIPLAQNFTDAVVLYVRTGAEPAAVLATVQREMRHIDPRLDVGDARTARKMIDQALFGATMTGGLLGVFGLLALGLASLGMYGVMAYSVSLRRREMGVRLALGASPKTVLTMVLRDGLRLVSVGLAVGAVGAGAISVALSRFLHGVGPIDPASFVSATAVLLTVAALACYLPARRASRVDPLAVLRLD